MKLIDAYFVVIHSLKMQLCVMYNLWTWQEVKWFINLATSDCNISLRCMNWLTPQQVVATNDIKIYVVCKHMPAWMNEKCQKNGIK